MLAPRKQTYLQRSIVTAVFGGGSFALTNLVTNDQFTQFALSIFVGGFALLVQLLVDIEHVQADAAEQLRRSTIAHLADGVEMGGRIRLSRFEPRRLIELIRAVAALSEDTPPMILEFLGDEVDRLAGLARSVSGGSVEVYGEDRDILLGFTKCVTTSIDAVSLRGVDRRDFWDSELGYQYLQLQRAAIIGRRVRIRRIFVFDELPDGDLASYGDVFAKHAHIGVQVRILTPGCIPDFLRSELLDFIVFDGLLSYETMATHPVRGAEALIRSNHCYFDPKHVQERGDRYESMWTAAVESPALPLAPGS